MTTVELFCKLIIQSIYTNSSIWTLPYEYLIHWMINRQLIESYCILYIWYLNGIQIGHLNIQSKPYKCYKLDRNAGLSYENI